MHLNILLAICLIGGVIATDYIPDSDRDRHTLHNELDVNSDGNYHYSYETSNGIQGKEAGQGGIAVTGGSSYISPEGDVISVSYVADETGYHPVGDHIPKVPDYILRSLEYIRAHPFKVRDYYTGEVKTVEHDNAAFDVYTRDIRAEVTTAVPPRTRTTPKTVYLTNAPLTPPFATSSTSPSLKTSLKSQQRHRRGSVRYVRRR